MKIRIISDLHLEINAGHPFRLKDTDTFTILCGDISGYYEKTSRWLNKYVKNGVFVSGNHILYNESKHSLQYFMKQFERNYPLSSALSYLNNNFKQIDDIVFVGGTLWTDYKLMSKDAQDIYMWYATRNLNDFRYGKFNPKSNVEKEDTRLLRGLQPEDCAKMFEETIKTIDETCKKFSDKKIVVVTHHAPSMMSVPVERRNSETSPCYASNLEDFILDHPNIKLWCHGHIHQASDYEIGNCRVICNPRGYVKYCENSGFDKDLMVDV